MYLTPQKRRDRNKIKREDSIFKRAEESYIGILRKVKADTQLTNSVPKRSPMFEPKKSKDVTADNAEAKLEIFYDRKRNKGEQARDHSLQEYK